MDEKPRKKKKSGHDYKKGREASQRKEAATSCSKITNFLTPKSQSRHGELIDSTHVNVAEELPPQSATSFDVLDVDIDSSNIEGHEKINETIATSKEAEVVPRQDNEHYNSTDYFKKPSSGDTNAFFTFHPNQPLQLEDGKPLPFDVNIFKFKTSSNEMSNRNWLSFNSKDQNLYCSVCLAFSDCSSVFCKGFDRYRHLAQTVGEHEKSRTHLESVKCFVAYNHNKSIDFLLFEKQLDKRKKEVAERRKVLHGVIDVIKLIGKQGMALRSKRNEEGYSLGDQSLNHGNFLEIFLLLSNYDDTLGKHVKTVINTSTAALEKRSEKKSTGNKKSAGRGSHMSFLSKTTVMKIVSIIKEIIVADLVKEINKSVIFSLLMDTTIDVSGYDQCAIVLRYVDGKEVKEKLLALETVQSTTGGGLLETVLKLLTKNGLKVENCVADSFDGASNMHGEYNGLAAKLKDLVPNHTHTWCYAHVLNLVIGDTAQCLPETISFFGLLQETQVFIKESCKRLMVYLERNPKLRLKAIGATRWRSRSDAATRIFGFSEFWAEETSRPTEDSELAKAVYPDLVISLSIISSSVEFNPKTRSDAGALLSKFLSFETTLIAMTFLKIFRSTTKLSDYLQTRNLDFSQAWAFVQEAQDSLKKLRNQYGEIKNAADRFVKYMSQSIINKIEGDTTVDTDMLQIETELPQKRVRAAKRVHGESNEDALILSSAEERFRIKVYNVIMDKLNSTIHNRFSDQKSLYLDLSCFDPRQLSNLKTGGLPSNALDRICTVVKDIDKSKLTEELQSFFDIWPDFRKSIQEKFASEKSNKDLQNDDSDTQSDDEDALSLCSETTKCGTCAKCVYSVIYDYNLYSIAYTELYKAYKYILTIPLTQVSCERTFSTLKFIKNRLRSSLNQDNLEALLMMQIEREKVSTIDNDLIIEKLCDQSTEMKRLLVF